MGLFNYRIQPAFADIEGASGGGYLRVAYPVWSLAGVRFVEPKEEHVQTSREEIETLFQGDLRWVAPVIQFTPSESREKESYAEIRRALYQGQDAA